MVYFVKHTDKFEVTKQASKTQFSEMETLLKENTGLNKENHYTVKRKLLH